MSSHRRYRSVVGCRRKLGGEKSGARYSSAPTSFTSYVLLGGNSYTVDSGTPSLRHARDEGGW